MIGSTQDESIELAQLLMRQREALARLGNGMRLMGAVTWLFVATVAYDALGLTMWLGAVTMMVGAVVAHRVRWVRLWGTALIDVPVLFAGMVPIVGTVEVDLGLLATSIVVPIVLMA